MSLKKPTVDDSFRVLHKKAHEFISDQHELLTEEYGFGDFDHYTVDPDTNILRFYKNESLVLAVSYQTVGHLTESTKEWRWYWSLDQIEEEALEELEVIKNYGDLFNFGLLTQAQWPAVEADAWAVTAIAAYLRGGKGIFKIQPDQTPCFIYFKEILHS